MSGRCSRGWALRWCREMRENGSGAAATFNPISLGSPASISSASLAESEREGKSGVGRVRWMCGGGWRSVWRRGGLYTRRSSSPPLGVNGGAAWRVQSTQTSAPGCLPASTCVSPVEWMIGKVRTRRGVEQRQLSPCHGRLPGHLTVTSSAPLSCSKLTSKMPSNGMGRK